MTVPLSPCLRSPTAPQSLHQIINRCYHHLSLPCPTKGSCIRCPHFSTCTTTHTQTASHHNDSTTEHHSAPSIPAPTPQPMISPLHTTVHHCMIPREHERKMSKLSPNIEAESEHLLLSLLAKQNQANPTGLTSHYNGRTQTGPRAQGLRCTLPLSDLTI